MSTYVPNGPLTGESSSVLTPMAVPRVHTAEAVAAKAGQPAPKPQTALQRLQASREVIRHAMVPPRRAALEVGGVRAPGWVTSLTTLPVVGVVAESVLGWWSQHPFRPLTQVITEASGVAIKPVAEESPILLVAGAAVAGVIVAWLRPWRWMLRSVVFAGLVPQLASRIASKLPIDAWVAMASELLSSRAGSKKRLESQSRVVPAPALPVGADEKR